MHTALLYLLQLLQYRHGKMSFICSECRLIFVAQQLKNQLEPSSVTNMIYVGFFEFKCICSPRTTTSCDPVGGRGDPLPIFRRFEWELLRCLPSAPRRWGKGHPFLPNKTNNSGQGRPMNHIEGGFRHDVAMPRDHTRPFCISRRNRISPAQWRGRRGNPDDGSGGC